jgi:hypothetical protein
MRMCFGFIRFRSVGYSKYHFCPCEQVRKVTRDFGKYENDKVKMPLMFKVKMVAP